MKAPPDDAADLAEPDLSVDEREEPSDRPRIVGADAEVGVERPYLGIRVGALQKRRDPALDVAVGVERIRRGDRAAGAVGGDRVVVLGDGPRMARGRLTGMGGLVPGAELGDPRKQGPEPQEGAQK